MGAQAVTLSLPQPEQTTPERGSKFASRKNFDRWIGSLPLANVSAARDDLLSGLQELNHARVSAKLRLQLMEAMREPVLTVVGALDKQFKESSFPLAEKVDRTGRAAIQFYRELALGYRITASQLVDGATKIPMLRQKAVALTLHRALSALNQMLYRAYLMYQPAATDTWQEIHTLFAFADQNNLCSKAFKDVFGSMGNECEITAVYRTICLMGLSDPSHLNQRAIQRLARAVEVWNQRCSVERGLRPVKPNSYQFEIQLHEDEPPRLIVEKTETTPDYVFDLSRLKGWLSNTLKKNSGQREIVFSATAGESLILDSRLVEQLVNIWGVRLERNYQRLDATHDLKLYVGLNDLHHLAANQQPFRLFFEEVASHEMLRQGSSAGGWMSNRSRDTTPVVQTAKVLNQSIGGYRLLFDDPNQLHIRVGELVAMRPASIEAKDANWLIGVVRWMHAISTSQIEIGVGVIGTDALPAVLCELDGQEKSVPPFRGLWVTPFDEKDDAPGAVLLVPAFFHRNEAKVLVCRRSDSEVHNDRVRLTGIVERTTEFVAYSFTNLGEEDLKAVPEDAKAPVEDFEDIG